MARTLRETIVSAGVIYPAGTSEKDVEGEVTADVWDGEADQADATPSESGAGYGSQSSEDLRAEVDKRNEGREDDAKIQVEGTGANGNVLKADLVKALEADDAAQA